MVSVARALLDRGLDDPNAPMLDQAVTALSPLGRVDWRLHHTPVARIVARIGLQPQDQQ